PGRHPLPGSDLPPTVQECAGLTGARSGDPRGIPRAAAAVGSVDPSRARGDLPEGDGEGACGPIRDGRGARLRTSQLLEAAAEGFLEVDFAGSRTHESSHHDSMMADGTALA